VNSHSTTLFPHQGACQPNNRTIDDREIHRSQNAGQPHRTQGVASFPLRLFAEESVNLSAVVQLTSRSLARGKGVSFGIAR